METVPNVAPRVFNHWHIAYVFDNVVPVLKNAGITDEQIDGIFIENPKRIFGG